MSASLKTIFLQRRRTIAREGNKMTGLYQLSTGVVGVGVQTNQSRENPAEYSLFKSFGPRLSLQVEFFLSSVAVNN